MISDKPIPETVTLTRKEFERYEKNTAMLNSVALAVEDFCRGEDTVLIGILRVIKEYHFLKSKEAAEWLEEEEKNNE
jgi:hypothetical protein